MKCLLIRRELLSCTLELLPRSIDAPHVFPTAHLHPHNTRRLPLISAPFHRTRFFIHVFFYFWSRGSQSDAKCFLGGTSALVYYREGCTSGLNPAHHRQGATDLDSFSVCPASKFTPLFSLSISNGPRCGRIPSRLSLLIYGIIISGSLMLMSSGWPAAKQQD